MHNVVLMLIAFGIFFLAAAIVGGRVKLATFDFRERITTRDRLLLALLGGLLIASGAGVANITPDDEAAADLDSALSPDDPPQSEPQSEPQGDPQSEPGEHDAATTPASPTTDVGDPA